MTEFSAIYYDGKTSSRVPVRVRALEHSLHISGTAVNLEVPLSEATVDPPIAGSRRVIDLPGGAQLHTDDHDAVAALFPGANRMQSWVHTLERRWAYALAAVAVTAAFTWWSVVYGLPFAATAASRLVPIDAEAKLGQQTLATIDKLFCNESRLAADRQQELRRNFTTLSAGLADGYVYRLEFRNCRMGPNAFALPGGSLVMTDDLVKLAQNDEQITAVLAHEIGHVRYRHGLRMTLQATGLAALISALAGDAVSITGLAATLPTVLLQTSYSREFEEEADDYAFRRLREIGLSPKYFAEIMTLLERHRDQRSPLQKCEGGVCKGESVPDYLSTHPATAKRIERALTYQ